MNLQQLSEKYDIGPETLQDVLKELAQPGYDPRDDIAPPVFAGNVLEFDDIQVGDTLQGVVRNITDFGAFVDVGLHNDGLVHKSQMADRYVAHPMDVVSIGQQVKVRVVDIDRDREKLSLSMKWEDISSTSDYQSWQQSKKKTINTEKTTDTSGSLTKNMVFIYNT